MTVAFGNYFSNLGYNNASSGTYNNGTYTLYEYGNAIGNGGPNSESSFYKTILPQELFWLPSNTSNGGMYHFSQYQKAMTNFNIFFVVY